MFAKTFNCPSTIRTIQFDLNLNWKKKEFSCFVFCDFSKAFDEVWHKGLNHKMSSYGVQRNLMKWFENNYTKERKKLLKKLLLKFRTFLSWGTSRVSIWSLMFLIYINDISLSRLFADDTSLGYSSQSVNQIKTVINHDLLELNAWSSKWLMSFNPEKI